jgi:hypothetical protein
MYFFEHQSGIFLILDGATNITIKTKNIDGWTITINKEINEVKLRRHDAKSKDVVVNDILHTTFQV